MNSSGSDRPGSRCVRELLHLECLLLLLAHRCQQPERDDCVNRTSPTLTALSFAFSLFWLAYGSAGVVISRTFEGVPITTLGVALILQFRPPNGNIGYIAMRRVFIAAGGSILAICEQITVMAAASHQHDAVSLAIEGIFSSIGWSNRLTDCDGNLDRKLPQRAPEVLAGIS